MSTKIIKVKSCKECPFAAEASPNMYYYDGWKCGKVGMRVTEAYYKGTIDERCPLQDDCQHTAAEHSTVKGYFYCIKCDAIL